MGEVLGGDFLLQEVRCLAKLTEGKKGGGSPNVKAGATKRVLNQPHKRPQPVIRAEWPWEQEGIHLGKVLYDRQRQRFRLWYTAQAATVIGIRALVRDNPF